MKKHYLLAFLVLLFNLQAPGQSVSPCLISSGIVKTFCPAGVNASIEDPWCAGIPKQIARSFNAEGLSAWIMPDKCWGWIGVDGTPYDDNAIPPGTTPVNCTPPYDRCFGNYCPDKYCSIIRSMIDLKASIILRAANTWGKYGLMKPGTLFYQSMKQIVIDINAAYDCNGLKRPVIQGTIFENIDAGVDQVPIPAEIITAYKTEPGFESSYYLDALGNPKTNLFFHLTRIRNNIFGSGLSDCPDITRIEARMWFYYQAKLFIDLGYTSIHMGQLNNWGRPDQPNYANTAATLAKIRAYAQSKSTFVLLTQENFRALKYPGTNTFMFDYDSRALRIREISNPQVCGDFDCTNAPVNYLVNSPCASEAFPAVIDQCVVSAQGNTSGVNPVYNTATPYQPFNTYFDFGPGDYPNPGVASGGCGSNPQWGTWGWDDTKWFAMKIHEPCRAFWMDDAIPRLRQYYNGFGFMAAPGLLAVPMPENSDRYLSGHNPTAGASYLLADEASVKNTVKGRWEPSNVAEIYVDLLCTTDAGQCTNTIPATRRRVKTYTFKVLGGDNTTVYTWHIQNPDASWQPHTYGQSRTFTAPADGTYTVYLRQDNLGKFSDNSTIKTISMQINLSRYCCGDFEVPPGGPVGLAMRPASTAYPQGSIPYEKNEDFTAYNDYLNRHGGTAHTPPLQEKKAAGLSAGLETGKEKPAIYPNPSDHFIYLKNVQEANLDVVKLTDVLGRTVMSLDGRQLAHDTFRINIAALKPAVYFVLIAQRNGQVDQFKLVKQ